MPMRIQARTLGDILNAESSNQLSRDVVLLAPGSGALEIGTVLAQRTSDSLWAPAEYEGSNGLDQPRAVLGSNVTLSAGSTRAIVLDQIARLKSAMFIFHASVNDFEKREEMLALLVRNTMVKTAERAGAAPVPTPLSITGSAPDGEVGVAYSFSPTITGGAPPYECGWILGSPLPAGLTLDEETGEISGTPSAAGPLAGTIAVVDSAATIRTLVVDAEIGGEAPSLVTAVLMGQSELNYMFNNSSSWSSIPMPTPGNDNLVLFLQLGPAGSPVQRVSVNPTTAVTNGDVNPAMANISAFLAFMEPGVTFGVADGAVGGTGRADLADSSTDGVEPNKRLWSDFTNVVDALEGEFGPTQYLVECWYNSDRSRIANFGPAFSPFYFGCTVDGSSFTLGTVHGPIGGRQIDHCLWDYLAPANAKGRGIFRKDTTKWMVNTAMRFDSAPIAPAGEWENFSNGTPIEPSRQVVIDFAANPMAAAVGMQVGPSMHIAQWQGDRIHPAQNEVDGLILFSWPIAFNLLRAAGRTINEPTIVGIEGPGDGTYADLLVSLPNGGNLTTLSALEARPAYAGASPHHQPVVGVEISRGVTRRPVYKTSETDYPAEFRGTVTITDAGSGSPRRGRVRVTPAVPFVFGNSMSYLRGQASGTCLYPRDDGLHPYMLIEHVPAWVDPAALYKCPGIAVRPFQTEMAAPVAAPAFEREAARFDNVTSFQSTAISVPGSRKLLESFFIRQAGTWTTGCMAEWRVGTTARLGFNALANGRMQFLLHQESGSNTFSAPTGTFGPDAWFHVGLAYDWDSDPKMLRVLVNGVPLDVGSYTFGGVPLFEQTLTRIGVGSAVGGSNQFVGDLAEVYVNIGETLDLLDPVNLAKFVDDGQPVDLGPNGALPTGNIPAYYYKGSGPGMINRGSAGGVPLIGALTVPPPPLPGF